VDFVAREMRAHVVGLDHWTKRREKMAKAARKITSAKRPTATSAPRAQKKNRAAARVIVPESTPFSLPDEDVEALLQSGERNGALEDYFGPEQYEELRGLAQQAATRSVRGGERVFILPGIMGSRIGRKGDVIWVDPIDILRGKLSELKLPPPKQPVQAVGVILLAYLSLKLRLRIAGFDADFFPFDWRQTIPDLGKALAKRITEERDAKKGKPLYVVAHSMGGLVTRASLPHLKDDQRPNRIVLLGTPHLGSFSPVQAFRGVHSTVNKVAALDIKHDPQDLAEIFATFPGLLEMIPAQSISKIDLFDLASWPNAGKRPDAAMLRSAKKVLTDLPTGPGEIIIVAGVNRDTVVEAKLEGDEFVYTIIKDGDGTVPLASARLSTASKIYFIEEDHGALAGNRQIQSALPSLLTTGKTSELSETFESSRAQVVRRVSDRQLATEVRSRGVPSIREQRVMIEEFAAPPSATPSVLTARPAEAVSLVPEPGAERFSGRVTVGRSQQQRLDITLARGSITEADAACYVVGVFQNVAPGGAAAAIDTMMGGAINDRVTRRMFGANVGEISMLPRGRRPLRAESVALAGLGAFDRFNAGVLDVVGENLIRTLLASRIDDFAVVLMGAGSGQSLNLALGNMIVGFLRGLKDTDGERQFRGITICETNEERYMAARSELFRLSPTNVFDDFELVFREIVLPEPRVVRAAAAPRPESPKVYLIVRQDRDREDKEAFTASLLTRGASAAIESGRMQIQDGAGSLDKHLKQLNGIENMTKAEFEAFGARLGEIVLTENVRQALKRNLDQHLVVVHDAGASRVPWETLRVQPDKPRPDSGFPAQSGGMSHRYEAANFSAAKWLRERQERAVLEVLLVIDPTKDLAGARREAERIKAILDGFGPRANYHLLFQDEARRTELLQCFSSGKFDVVHYAGHAFFDETVRGQSGILCAGREVLSGADLAGIGNLPCLMFFNACESARVRKSDAAGKEPAKSPANIARGVSFAEALLRGGVANFVGTHWPVGDAAAAEFAAKFYEHVIGGATLNKAILEGRDAVRKLDSRDWADYVFYGDADFQVKTSGSSRGTA
jgi:pimeloyl-ACP methyl ester carboxylesterase